MKNSIFIIALITCSMFLSSALKQTPNSSKLKNPDEKILSEITYQRVFHDNIWWIVVYQDGVKINEYPDIDSM